MIVVLGGGLAGLSTAFHLQRAGHEALVLEREDEVGGLARSIDASGFTFDFTGHLLHVKDEGVITLIDELLGGEQVMLERSAWIAYRGALVPYPFQANLSALPDDVRLDCLLGFAESLRRGNALEPGSFDPPKTRFPLSFLDVKVPRGGYAASFATWARATFGRGLADHFFLPYNAKNFATDLETITAEWVSWAVPKPDLEDVLRGALAMQRKVFGYNPRFRYPRRGGIRALPDALAKGLRNVERAAAVTRIDAKARRVHLADGRSHAYRSLVATNPLPELVAMVDDLPAGVRQAAAKLRWCAVASYNFGIAGGLDHERHWIYYPDPQLPFYRVGFPSNLTPQMAPDGTSSLCAEVAYRGTIDDGDRGATPSLDDVATALRRCGALPAAAKIEVATRVDLPYGYVLFDADRRAALPAIFAALLERDIIPVGRYGAWDYLSMEQTILQGRETATYLASRP
jgi:protoporphyrinogen oxidase